MSQKGFIKILFIILVLVLVVALGYITIIKNSSLVKKSQDSENINNTVSKNQPATQTSVDVAQTLPTSCVDQHEAKAVITSLSGYHGSVGTTIEIKGCNFAGFEGDKNVWIENSAGVKGILYGEQGSTAKLVKVVLKSPLCSKDNSYTGFPCDSFLTLTPGEYKIWIQPWGENTKSNFATFTIQ